MVPVLNPITNDGDASEASRTAIRRRLLQRICREDTRRTGATRRSGTATPASTIRMHRREGSRVVHGENPPGPQNPAFCKARLGSSFGEGRAAERSPRVSSRCTIRRPAKWSLINTCFTTQHLYFAKDANNTLWTSAGGPDSGVVGWLNTKMYEQTGDEVKSQGWTPLILDTNGNGKRDEYVEANQPLDPKQGQARHGGVLRRAAEPGRRFHLGPGDGRRLLAHGSARLHHPAGARPQSVADRAGGNLPAAGYRLRVARHRPRSRTAWSGRRCRADIWRASIGASARARSTDRRRPPANTVRKAGRCISFRARSSRASPTLAAPTTPTTSGSIATTRSGSGRTCRSPRPTAVRRSWRSSTASS